MSRSLYLTHSWNGEVQGLKAVPAADRPYVPIVFFAFRIMVGVGLVLLTPRSPARCCGGADGCTRRIGSTALRNGATPLGFIAVLAGWTATGDRPAALRRLRPPAHGRRGRAVAPRGAVASRCSISSSSTTCCCSPSFLPARIVLRGPEPAAAVHCVQYRADPALEQARRSVGGSHPAPRRVCRQRRMMHGLCPSISFVCVAAFCVAIYVLADGFDLGVGILFLFAPRDEDRDLMMESIEPVWDGNETWLVLGGTLLLGGLPGRLFRAAAGLLPADHARCCSR